MAIRHYTKFTHFILESLSWRLAVQTFQVLTLCPILQLYWKEIFSATYVVSNIAVLLERIMVMTTIAQMIFAFGMNPKVRDSSPPRLEIFSLSKTLSLSTCVRESKMNVLSVQSTFRVLTLKNNIHIYWYIYIYRMRSNNAFNSLFRHSVTLNVWYLSVQYLIEVLPESP